MNEPEKTLEATLHGLRELAKVSKEHTQNVQWITESHARLRMAVLEACHWLRLGAAGQALTTLENVLSVPPVPLTLNGANPPMTGAVHSPAPAGGTNPLWDAITSDDLAAINRILNKNEL